MQNKHCLLYTSDAADERSSVDLGGRRIIKKKKKTHKAYAQSITTTKTEDKRTREHVYNNKKRA